MNVLDFFDMSGFFFFNFVISRNTEILIEPNYWLGMYVPYILNKIMVNYPKMSLYPWLSELSVTFNEKIFFLMVDSKNRSLRLLVLR